MEANNEVNIVSLPSSSIMSDDVLGSLPAELLKLEQLWAKCANTY